MHAESHRIRFAVVIALLTLFALLVARPSHGAWGTEPVTVSATAAVCPIVAACPDGAGGTVVVWQENTASGGTLRSARLTATGDTGPAWPVGALVSDVDAARTDMGAVTDAQGGAYVWWMQGSALMLTHLTASGAVAPGWNAHGRSLGTLVSAQHRPIAKPDRSGGVYVGWLKPASITEPRAAIGVVHLGPNASGAGGWPASGRTFGLVGTTLPSVSSFGMDVAGDDGLWLSFQTLEWVEPFGVEAGQHRAMRVTSAGLPSPGWTSQGVLLGTHAPITLPGWSTSPAQSHVAVADDGAGGVFVVSAEGIEEAGSFRFDNRLRHLDALGASFGSWDPAGTGLGDLYADGMSDPGAPASLRAFADGHGGLYSGLPWFATESTRIQQFTRFDAAGALATGGLAADQLGLEFAPRPDGGMFIASYKPSGATSAFDGDAYVRLSQSTGPGYFEIERSYSAQRYGDIGLAADDDGFAVLAWSQMLGRQGVFAVRVGPAGQVTGVTPGTSRALLSARFERGRGVAAALGGDADVQYSLLDLQGRIQSSVRARAGGETVFPGSEGIAPGVYFVRAKTATTAHSVRVLVLR